ncbi:hypothetical protein L0F63_000456 [Massospora cicadina]|nr:hypothetical protein L0F63_000456 [Massospora cicadina]
MPSTLKVPVNSESRRSSISSCNSRARSNKSVSFDDHVLLRTFKANSTIPLLREKSFESVAQLDVPVKDLPNALKKPVARSKSLSAAFRKLLSKTKSKRHSIITLG